MTEKELILSELTQKSGETILSVESLRQWLDVVAPDLVRLTFMPEGTDAGHFVGTIDVKGKVTIEVLDLNDMYNNDNFPANVTIIDLTKVGVYGLSDKHSLQNISLPNVIDVGNTAFAYDDSLESIDIPACLRINTAAFYKCSALESVNAPLCERVDGSAFYDCDSLETISLPSCTHIGLGAFSSCGNLRSIYLNANQVVTLAHTNAFSDLPNDYSVYVPFIWLFDYQSATNWSQITDHIKPITNNLGTGTVIYNGIIIEDESHHELSCIVISGAELENEADSITVTMPSGVNKPVSTTAIYIGNYESVDDIDKSHSAIVEHQSWIKLNFTDTNFIPGQTYTFIKGGYVVKGGA